MNLRSKPFGFRAALAMIFLSSLSRDFAANATTLFQKLRNERPHEYLKLVMNFLPPGELTEKILNDMTDDEIFDFALELRSIVRGLDDATAQDSEATEREKSQEENSSS